MAEIRVRRVRDDDVQVVAGAMRPADQDEAALFGLTPADGLQLSVEASLEAWTVDVDGVPAAIFGLARSGDATGAPWLLATDAFVAGGMRVARRARRIVRTWARTMALANYCDARNVVAVRFLEWLGFVIEPRSGRVLIRFTMPLGGGR